MTIEEKRNKIAWDEYPNSSVIASIDYHDADLANYAIKLNAENAGRVLWRAMRSHQLATLCRMEKIKRDHCE